MCHVQVLRSENREKSQKKRINHLMGNKRFFIKHTIYYLLNGRRFNDNLIIIYDIIDNNNKFKRNMIMIMKIKLVSCNKW